MAARHQYTLTSMDDFTSDWTVFTGRAKLTLLSVALPAAGIYTVTLRDNDGTLLMSITVPTNLTFIYQPSVPIDFENGLVISSATTTLTAVAAISREL